MNKTLCVRDIMSPHFVAVKPEMEVVDALQTMLTRNTPVTLVVNAEGKLVGVLSENDCLKTVVNSTYHNSSMIVGKVEDLMTKNLRTVEPSMDIYSLAALFVEHTYRRYPVIDEGRLIGQVSRRDVLKAVKGFVNKGSKTGTNPIIENPKDTRLSNPA